MVSSSLQATGTKIDAIQREAFGEGTTHLASSQGMASLVQMGSSRALKQSKGTATFVK